MDLADVVPSAPSLPKSKSKRPGGGAKLKVSKRGIGRSPGSSIASNPSDIGFVDDPGSPAEGTSAVSGRQGKGAIPDITPYLGNAPTNVVQPSPLFTRPLAASPVEPPVAEPESGPEGGGVAELSLPRGASYTEKHDATIAHHAAALAESRAVADENNAARQKARQDARSELEAAHIAAHGHGSDLVPVGGIGNESVLTEASPPLAASPRSQASRPRPAAGVGGGNNDGGGSESEVALALAQSVAEKRQLRVEMERLRRLNGTLQDRVVEFSGFVAALDDEKSRAAHAAVVTSGQGAPCSPDAAAKAAVKQSRREVAEAGAQLTELGLRYQELRTSHQQIVKRRADAEATAERAGLQQQLLRRSTQRLEV